MTIREGGPQVNQMQLLMAGRLDFNLGGGRAIEFAQQNLPFVAVAAIFQKDPSVLIAHPGAGQRQLRRAEGQADHDQRRYARRLVDASWRRSSATRDSQIRPYTFNLAPFLADKKAIQQGYLGSEPFSIKQQAGIRAGGAADRRCRLSRAMAASIATSDKMIERQARPGAAVHRCVDRGLVLVSVRRSGAGEPLIKQANPEMTDALLAYGRDVMKTHGIVDSGDALKLGIGAMTDGALGGVLSDHCRRRACIRRGWTSPKAYTLRFVNQKVGMDMKH